MSTIELYKSVRQIPPMIKFGDHGENPKWEYVINLVTLTSDLLEFKTIKDWLDSKNMPDHLRKNIIKALISIEPPENARNELIMMIL